MAGRSRVARPAARHEPRRDRRERLSAAQRLRADEMQPEVEVAEHEPALATPRSRRLERLPALPGPAPAALRVVEPGEAVEDRVEVGRDVQAEHLEVVADVADDRQLTRRRARRGARRRAWRRRRRPRAGRSSRPLRTGARARPSTIAVRGPTGSVSVSSRSERVSTSCSSSRNRHRGQRCARESGRRCPARRAAEPRRRRGARARSSSRRRAATEWPGACARRRASAVGASRREDRR